MYNVYTIDLKTKHYNILCNDILMSIKYFKTPRQTVTY